MPTREALSSRALVVWVPRPRSGRFACDDVDQAPRTRSPKSPGKNSTLKPINVLPCEHSPSRASHRSKFVREMPRLILHLGKAMVGLLMLPEQYQDVVPADVQAA